MADTPGEDTKLSAKYARPRTLKPLNLVGQETVPSAYTRGLQHKAAVETGDVGKAFAKHFDIHHPEEKFDHTIFELKVIQ